MKHHSLRVALPFAALFCSASALGQSAASVRKELQAAYNRYYAAYQKKDVKTILGLMDPKFVQDSGKGATQDMKAFQKSLDEYCKKINAMDKFVVKVGEPGVSGNTATATVYTMTQVRMTDAKGSYGKKGKEVVAVFEHRDRDTWTKTPGGWRWLRSVEVAPMKIKINGQVVP